MSHDRGQVYYGGRLIAICAYNTVSDLMRRPLFDSFEDVVAWLDDATLPERSDKCTCGKPPVPVTLYSDYGNGCYWRSTICPTCRVITGEIDPHEDAERRGRVLPRKGRPRCFVDRWGREGR